MYDTILSHHNTTSVEVIKKQIGSEQVYDISVRFNKTQFNNVREVYKFLGTLEAHYKSFDITAFTSYKVEFRLFLHHNGVPIKKRPIVDVA